MSTTGPQQPAASAVYMDLIFSNEGAIIPNIQKLRSRVIDLEPTRSYAIAWTGYEQCNARLVRLLREAWHRLSAREDAILSASELVPREVWQLRDDVERFGELVNAAEGAQNNLKKNKLQFEMDIHMSVVDLVRVRWELEECEF